MWKHDKVTLNENTPNVTKTAVAAAAALSEFMSYQVPYASRMIIEPNDYAFMHLADATGPIADGSRVVIQVTDSVGRRSQYYADAGYKTFQEEQDVTKKYFFGQHIEVKANWKIKLLAAPVTNGIATATYRFAISCTLVYETLD